jgi:hypothetical protein
MQQEGLTAANAATRHPETYSTPLVRVDQAGRIHTLILVTAVSTQVEATLATHDVTVESTDARRHSVQAWIPFERLEIVAMLPFVRYLHPPHYAHRR